MLPAARHPRVARLFHMLLRSPACSTRAAVKDAVVDALDELHLAGRQPQDAALSLISLTYDASLGER